MIKYISNLINRISSIKIVKGLVNCKCKNRKQLLKNFKVAVPALSISLFAGALVCLNSQNLNSFGSDASQAEVKVAANSNNSFSFIPKFFDAETNLNSQATGGIDDPSNELVEGYGLYINGKLIGVVFDESKIDEILNSILYMNNVEGGIASFVENIEKTAGLYSVSDVKTNDELREILSKPSFKAELYTVEAGDTPISVAKKFNMSLAELDEVNGGDVSPFMIAGESINVVKSCSPINVKVSKLEKKEKEISYTQIVKYDSQTDKGRSYVQQNGKNGVEVETEEVEYINGREVNRSFVSKEIIVQPVNEVTVIGTKEKVKQTSPAINRGACKTSIRQTKAQSKADILEEAKKENKKQNKKQDKKQNKNKKKDKKQNNKQNNNKKTNDKNVSNDQKVAKAPGNGIATGKFAWPVKYTRNITSGYGPRWGSFHEGIDIAQGGIMGQPVFAADGGYVESVVYSSKGYGNNVVINHGNGFKTRYAHLSKITVKKGQKISKGEQLGNVGSTGFSTGAHLHVNVVKNGKCVNPIIYLGR